MKLIRFLLAADGDAEQAARLRRFFMASAIYAVCAPLLYFAHVNGLVAFGPALYGLAAMAAVNAVLYLLFRSGLNLRFSDPSLTWLQTCAAGTVLLYVVYSFDRERHLALFMCFVVLQFGAFRFGVRQFLNVALQFLAGYALVIYMLMRFKPETVDIHVAWLGWVVLACMLPCLAVIAGRLGELRRRLSRSNEELGSALVTIQQLATHDSLTGLPNRSLLLESLQHALAQAGRHGRELALFFMDLDNFKTINDTLGHAFGDQVLKEAAARLAKCVRGGDIVARLGGDEFVLLVDEFDQVSDLVDIANKLLATVVRPAMIDGHELNISVSIGICTFPRGGRDAQSLLSNADVAMYRAKQEGRNSYAFYTPEMNRQATERIEMEALLQRALERQEFELHYQPKVDVKSGRITGAEALIRWNSKELGRVSPERFIPLAEESGLIVRISKWVLETACAQNKAWQDEGFSPLLLSVNLSPRQFREKNLADMIAVVLGQTGLEARFLELEITEAMIMHDTEKAVAILERLHPLGIQLSVDDFGTGYSSLAHLQRFPVHKLKIDQSFVQDIATDSGNSSIVTTVIAMARGLKLGVIAEGVETGEQLAFLAGLHCDEYQGYYFSRPVPAEDFARLLVAAPRKAAKLVAIKGIVRG